MSIGDKYKISELAKDFGVPTKTIVDLLTAIGPAPKSNSKVLEPHELNYIFEHMTQSAQVDDIYTALEAQKKEPVKAEEPKAAPAPKAAPVKKDAPKAAPVKKDAPRAQNTAKSEQVQSLPNRNTNGQRPERRDDRRSDRPQQPRSDRPQQNAAPKAAEKPAQQQPQQQNRPDNRRSENRPQSQRTFQAPKDAPKAQPKPQPKPQPAQARPQGTVLVPNANASASGESVKIEKKVHVIDTRNTTVDQNRYDERIENYVPDSVAHSQTKQKLTKKNANDQKQKFAKGNKKKNEEADKLRRLQMEMQKKQPLKVMIPDEIAVGELATRLKKTASDVIKELMKLGIMASISQFIDFDTASLVAMELGAKVEHEVIVTIEDKLIDDSEDKEENLQPRSPVVVVMGHVDHGKTSTLDYIRRTNVTAGEAGGITQHIGAYRVKLGDREITFLDTPGHEAFTSMRARGASVTDIVILVVAADDGIMPQTIEAINHAKAANVPIVVAVNKIDKENAQPDRVLQQMTEYGLVPEDWGGDTIVCKISALKGIGIENLLEMVLLTADMQELKANPDRLAKGTVIEARLDKGRGPIATVLVQNGTLHSGDIIIAGTSVGRIRVMTDENGKKIESAGPSIPVEIVGLGEVPNAGDIFHAVEDERMARELVEQRKAEEKDEKAKTISLVSLDSLFDHIKEGEMKELNIIVKADVNGTSEAVKASLEKLTNDEVRVRVIHTGVGAVNEGDVMLASASNAIIVGFNVRPSAAAIDSAALQGVDMRMYRVIYDCLEEMEAAMKGMLAPKFKEVVLGHAEIRQTFKVSGVGTIAGCYVQDGKIVRNCKVRVVRDGIIVFEGDLASLKRFKDDAKEVAQSYECGLSIEKFNDIKEGDIIESFIMEQIKQ